MNYENSEIPEYELNFKIFREYLTITFEQEQFEDFKGDISIYEDSLSDYVNHLKRVRIIEETINDPLLLQLDWEDTIRNYQPTDYDVETHTRELRRKIQYLKNQYGKAEDFLFSRKQASLRFHWDVPVAKNEVKIRSMAESLSTEARKYATTVFYKEHIPLDSSFKYIRFAFELLFKE